MKFIKHDDGKPRPSLWPLLALGGFTAVLEYGARKYAPENWRRCKDTVRYYDAALRHLLAWKSGERNDPESGLSHIDHALCCLAFISEMEKR
jgi:hypothetical protein